MNSSWIILYAGSPMKLPEIKMVGAGEATAYASEVDAWAAVRRHHLTYRYCRVLQLQTFLEMGQKTSTPK